MGFEKVRGFLGFFCFLTFWGHFGIVVDLF